MSTINPGIVVLTDPAFLDPVTVQTAIPGGYDTEGIWVDASTSESTPYFSSQVTTDKELLLLPEGERNKTLRTFYGRTELKVSENNVAADVILDHLGADWKVIKSANWELNGYYYGICEALPVGSANNPENTPAALVAGPVLNLDLDQALMLDVDGDPVEDGDGVYTLISDSPARQCAVFQSTGSNMATWYDEPRLVFTDGHYSFGRDPGLLPLLATFTAFFILRPDASSGTLLQIGDPSSTDEDQITIGLTTEVDVSRTESPTEVSVQSGGTVDLVGKNIVVVQVSPERIYARLINDAGDNADELTTSILPLISSDEYTLAGITSVYSGDWYQLLMYNEALTDTEIEQNVTHLKNEYGIT